MPSIYLCNKQNWSPIFRVTGALTNIVLNIILIPIYEIKGAAVATAVSYGLMFLFLYYKNKKWMPINLYWNDILLYTFNIILSMILFLLDYKIKFIFLIVVIMQMFYLLYKYGIKNFLNIYKVKK